MRSDCQHGRSYAPAGKTPVQPVPGGRFAANMISTLTNQRKARFTQAGFVVPDALPNILGSNVDKNRHYDQITYHQRLARLKPTGRAGVFDFYE